MKKTYMIGLALLASATMAGAQSFSVQTSWVKEVSNSVPGTSVTSQGGSMAFAADGNLLVVGQAGSTSDEQSILFGGDEVATGVAGYSGNSANQGLVAMKLTTGGDVLWSICQSVGEISSNEDRIAATADGGAVIFTNVRHTEGNSAPIAFTDAAGDTRELAWELVNGDTRAYLAIVIKVDADGVIEWIKELTPDITAAADKYPAWSQAKDVITQGIKTNALDVDAVGNIYVGGIMCADVTVDGVTIPCHNVDTWNGSAQKTAGNLFVIKLDADGNYINHLVSGGSSTQETVQRLQIVGDKIYMLAWAVGLANTDFSLDDNTFTPANTYGGILVAELNTNLGVNWANYIASSVSGSAWNEHTLAAIGDKLYVAGSAKFGLTIGDKTYTNSATRNAREPWLIQFDATNGQPTACLVKASNQNSFYGLYEGVDGNLYVAQRGLTPASALWTSTGLLNKIDPTSLEVLDQAEYCNFTASAQSLLARGTDVYLMFRHGAKNVDVTFAGSGEKFNSEEFRWVQQSITVPESAGTISGIDLGGLDPSQPIVLDLGGDTYQLNASVIPATAANGALIYSSSNESVATIDENGLITADKHGTWSNAPARRAPAAETATITVTSAGNPSVKQSIQVRVDNPTAVRDLNADKGGVSVSGNIVTATGSEAVTVYNTLGQRVAVVNAGQSATLPTGIYIAAGSKLIVR